MRILSVKLLSGITTTASFILGLANLSGTRNIRRFGFSRHYSTEYCLPQLLTLWTPWKSQEDLGNRN